MEFDDLQVGMSVRVINWQKYPPEHWAEEMNEWCGAIVTIMEVSRYEEYVYIEEDGGEWQWYPWDFEFHHRLKPNDPNRLFNQQKHYRLMRKLRIELQSRQESNKS